MKFVYPEINKVFDTAADYVNTLVVENQKLLYRLTEDIQNQINGLDGKSVLSIDNKILPINKSLELITQFVPFEINRKSLITKICSVMEAKAFGDEYSLRTSELLSEIEKHLLDLSFDLSCNLDFDKLNFSALLKASGVEITDNYDSLGEKIIDLIELITEFDRTKLYVIINMRSYLSDDETASFIDTVIRHQYHVLLIESSERSALPNECRYIVDENLCEIC